MIYMIKGARDQKELTKSKPKESHGEDNVEEDEKEKLSSEHSMPFDSDSDSVYEHCQKHYLDTNESLAMDMRFCNEAHHMRT